MLKRVHHDASNKRPLVDDQFQECLSRQSLYESVSSFTVNVDHIRIEEVAENYKSMVKLCQQQVL